MIDEASNRVRERRIMLIIWTAVVAVIVWLGAGFGGGFAVAFKDNPPAWMLLLSPLLPLMLWHKARRDGRASKHKPVEKSE